MQKFISTKSLYTNFKKISDEVQKGTTFIVLKHSRPAYQITPLSTENFEEKKYTLKDIDQFTFQGKNKKEKNLATNFKKYIYT